MRKFLLVAIPIITLVLFIAIMLSGSFLKKPLGDEIGIPEAIDELINEIKDENWDEVDKKTEGLKNTWEKIVSRVQFSSERDEINFFSMALARLEGAIIKKDSTAAIIELKEAYEHWQQLAK